MFEFSQQGTSCLEDKIETESECIVSVERLSGWSKLKFYC